MPRPTSAIKSSSCYSMRVLTSEPDLRLRPNKALLRNGHRSPAMMAVPAVLTCALAHGRLQLTASRARSFAFEQAYQSALAATECQPVGWRPSMPVSFQLPQKLFDRRYP